MSLQAFPATATSSSTTPKCAELLESGHILSFDENNNRAIEVRRELPLGAGLSDNTAPGNPNINEPSERCRVRQLTAEWAHADHGFESRPRIVEIDQNKQVV
jgi:hypothetical protein